MPVMDTFTSDEENEVPPARPLQKTSRKARDDLSDNVQLPNRTRGALERTVSAKQQAISKCFPRVRGVLADVRSLDNNNKESLQMKVARLEKENTKLKRKELRNKGLYFSTCIFIHR